MSASAASASPPLRILCIHGFCQSATTFRGRTAAIKNKLKKQATFTYIDAPHSLQPGEHVFVDESSTPGSKLTWWRVKPDGYYDGVLESMQQIRAAFESNGTFDGLFGFSQGGSVVGLLCSLLSLHRRAQQSGVNVASLLPTELASSPTLAPLLALDLSFLSSVKFAMLFAAFIPRDPSYRAMLLHQRDTGQVFDITSLHVMGDRDNNILVSASEELMSCFQSPVPFVHSGAHHVPSDKLARELYIHFIGERSAEIAGNTHSNGGETCGTGEVVERAAHSNSPPPRDLTEQGVEPNPGPSPKSTTPDVVVTRAAPVIPPPPTEVSNSAKGPTSQPQQLASTSSSLQTPKTLPKPGMLEQSLSTSPLSTLPFNPGRQPIADLTLPPAALFHNIASIARPSTSTSDGVLFLGSDAGVFVLKSSVRLAHEHFACLLCEALDVPTARMQLLGHTDAAFDQLGRALTSPQCPTEEHHSTISTTLNSSVICIMEFFPGTPLDSLDANVLKASMNAERWRAIGKIAAFDCIANNTDRLPLKGVFDHEGNAGNILVASPNTNVSSERGVISIDPNVVTLAEEFAAQYHERVEGALNDFFARHEQSDIITSIRDFIQSISGYAVTVDEKTNICQGFLSVLTAASSLTCERIEAIKQRVDAAVTGGANADDHWREQIEQIRPPFLAHHCQVIRRLAAEQSSNR